MKHRTVIGIVTGIFSYFMSIHFVFQIPLPTGGYHWSTYAVGVIIGITACIITVVLLRKKKQAMQKCPHCGEEIPEESAFCLFCGQYLNQ